MIQMNTKTFVNVYNNYPEVANRQIRFLRRYLRFTQNAAFQNTYWCRFMPSYQSHIGSRSEKTVNLITKSFKSCYAPQNITGVIVGHCRVLEFAFGRIYDGRTESSRCAVNPDKMYTLILAMSWEYGLIKINVEDFSFKLGDSLAPNYFLLFISTNETFGNKLCDYRFAAKSRLFDCLETFSLFDTLKRKRATSPRVWLTSSRLIHSPNYTLDYVVHRRTFTNERVKEILMKETLNRANESAGTYNFNFEAKMIILPKHEILMSSSVLVDDMTTRFISCYEKPTLRFQMYIKPFDVEVWGFLALCCCSIAVLIYIYNRTFHLSGSFSPIFFFFSTLVEEPYSVPVAIWNSKIFKIITLTWLLMAIVFTNLYIGLMISDVTAPVRGEIFNTFDKVLGMKNDNVMPPEAMASDIKEFWYINYTSTIRLTGNAIGKFQQGCDRLYARKMYAQYDGSGYESHHAQFRNSDSFALLQKEDESCTENAKVSNQVRKRFLSIPWMYTVFNRLYGEIRHAVRLHLDFRYISRTYRFFSPRNRFYPKDPQISDSKIAKIQLYSATAIENELVACERSIFLGESKALNHELSYLKINYPRKYFYISNDTLETGWSKPIVWMFMNSGSSKVPRYFKMLSEAGIRDVLLGLRKEKYYLKRRSGTQFVQEGMLRGKSIGMSGSIQTIFIISITCFSVATLVFYTGSWTQKASSVQIMYIYQSLLYRITKSNTNLLY
jgi:hypothetical protein